MELLWRGTPSPLKSTPNSFCGTYAIPRLYLIPGKSLALCHRKHEICKRDHFPFWNGLIPEIGKPGCGLRPGFPTFYFYSSWLGEILGHSGTGPQSRGRGYCLPTLRCAKDGAPSFVPDRRMKGEPTSLSPLRSLDLFLFLFEGEGVDVGGRDVAKHQG